MSAEHDSDADDEPSVDPTRELTGHRGFLRSHPRQQLTFVRASAGDAGVPTAPARDAASLYEAIVLKHLRPPSGSAPEAASEPTSEPTSGADLGSEPGPATIAHQVGLEHSHPPSHLDRGRHGFRYLASYGWDADARKGLGPEGEGVRAPVKAVRKIDTTGIGAALDKKLPAPQKPPLLDAGKVRKQYAKQHRRDAKLRDLFYGDDKVERYLGESTDALNRKE